MLVAPTTRRTRGPLGLSPRMLDMASARDERAQEMVEMEEMEEGESHVHRISSFAPDKPYRRSCFSRSG